ncbi:hypothetical protein [Sulfurospirillum halorespirans]|nr:hypothetical protein [Sulfurospirillum halorespirans]
MQNEKTLLVSLTYENLTKKILKSFFNFFMLPIILGLNIMLIIAIVRHKNLIESLALSITLLIVMGVFFLTIVLFLLSMKFLLRRYSQLEIFEEKIIINNTTTCLISDIEFVPMPSFLSKSSRWFELKEKNSDQVIAHFVYRFYNTYFFKHSPEIVKKIIQNDHSLELNTLLQMIKQDTEECVRIQNRNEDIRTLTILLFLVLIFLTCQIYFTNFFHM